MGVLQISGREAYCTKKFSVRPQVPAELGGSKVAFVHVSRDGKFIVCQNGECRAMQGNRRSVKTFRDLSTDGGLCDHLKVMRANSEVWMTCEVAESEGGTEADLHSDEEELNSNIENPITTPADDDDLPASAKTCFNRETCKWDFGGRSYHKPAEEYCTKLSRCVRERNKMHDVDPHSSRTSEGHLIGPSLVPRVDASINCDCGHGFVNDVFPNGLEPELDYTTILYTRNCPVKCDVFKRKCLGGKCTKLYSGSQDCIHFWSKETCAGDEIGWDFVRRVITSKITFTSFCNDYSAVYRSSFLLSSKFMSRSSFIKWFFSWAGRLDIDFRECCKLCGENPKFLACDGTHVGLSFRNLHVIPIEQADLPDTVEAAHKRNDRCFLYYNDQHAEADIRKARQDLLRICKKKLSCLGDCTDNISIGDIQNIVKVTPLPVQDVVSDFASNRFSGSVDVAFAAVFKILAHECAVVSFVPYRYLDALEMVCNSILDTTVFLEDMRGYSPELHWLFQQALVQDDTFSLNSAVRLVKYLVEFVHRCHDGDVLSQEASPIASSYNPESGVAYYFTKSGQKLRKLPKYRISSSSVNHDDLPHHSEFCKKNYPKVSQGGFSYMFLWFCPLHGHCYGFHIIPGSEGRKDPFASLFCYLPEYPHEVFYDFACSLSEYCLNREPGFWKNTRFWHDIFHSFPHKCAKVFRSDRIIGMDVVDSEICEQFNSYIQCIKYTGSHLSQSHFCFFMQFMIHQWNLMKEESFFRKLQVAIAGSE